MGSQRGRGRFGISWLHSLRKQLAETGLPSLIQTMNSCAKNLPDSVWQKLLKIHTSTQENEADIFIRSQPWSCDLLTYLLLKGEKESLLKGEKESASQVNEQVLQCYSDDVIAKVNRFELLLVEQCPTEAEEMLEELRGQVTLQQRQEAELGLAYCISCLPPAFLPTAIAKYTRVLSKEPCLVSLKHWIFAIYQLAVTYGKFLSKGVSTEYGHDYAPQYCIEMIVRLLSVVLQSGDEVLVPRAWAELANAMHRYERAHGVAVCVDNWGECASVSQCFEKALQVRDDDPHVLELAGRYYRDVGVLDRAKQLLERTTKISPHRHVAWHHLGLLHKQLWQRASGMPSYSRKGKRNKPLHLSIPLVSGELQLISSGADCNSTASSGTPDIAQVWKAINQVYQSGKPEDFSKRRTQRKSSRNDQCPVNTVEPGSEHLRNAYSCFLKASEAYQHSNCRYLVDLSRAQFSLGRPSEALKSLRTAAALLCNEEGLLVHNADAVYLYEQWAFQLQASKSSSVESIKDKYRLAVECAIRAKSKPHFAYERLKAILRKQNEECLDSKKKEKLETERIMLELSVNNTVAAGKELDSQPEKVQLLEAQIQRFVQVGHYASAYTYLTALLHERSGQLPGTMAVGDVLDIAKEAAKGLQDSPVILRDILNRFLPLPHDECLKGLYEYVHQHQDREQGSLSCQCYSCLRNQTGQISEQETHRRALTLENVYSEANQQACDLVLLATDGIHSAMSKLQRYLRSSCGLEVFLGATERWGDVPIGVPIISYIGQKCEVSRTRGILILGTDYQRCETLKTIVREIMCAKARPPLCCLVPQCDAVPQTLCSLPHVQIPEMQDREEEEAALKKFIWDIVEKLVLKKIARDEDAQQ